MTSSSKQGDAQIGIIRPADANDPHCGPAPLLDNRGKNATSLSEQDLQEEHKSESKPIEERLERYARAKIITSEMGEWLNDQIPDKAKGAFLSKDQREMKRVYRKLDTCGDLLVFKEYLSGETRLSGGCYCQQARICQFCALRTGGRLLRRLFERCNAVISQRSDLRVFLVTLTVRNGQDLQERLQHLKEGLRKQVSRANKRRNLNKGKRTIFENFEAWYRTIEIKRGKNSGLWHPHAHMIVFTEDKPNASDLSMEWKEVTGDSYVVDVAEIDTQDEAMLLGGLMEVCKYLAKFDELDPASRWKVYTSTKRKHLRQSYGLLRFSHEDEDSINQVLDDPLDEPYVEHFYRFVSGKYVHFDSTGEKDHRHQRTPEAFMHVQNVENAFFVSNGE